MKKLSGILRNRSAVLGFCIFLQIAVAFVDSATGPEVSLSIFYLIPSTLVAWFVGKREGIGLAIVSSVLWLAVELNFGKEYKHKLVPYCNGLLQLGMALFSSFLTAILREREKAVVQATEGRKKAEMELHLERVLADAIETEQQRLGRDIHDGLGQHLVSAGFVASMLKTRLEERELPEAKDAEELTALLTDAIGQSRRLARGLFPVKLEAEGLSSALQELTDNVSAHSRIDCRFESSGIEIVPDPGVSVNLYRIAQEAINNAVKHAEPKSIVVQLKQGRSRIELSIVNDGKEFSPTLVNQSGMGLRIMEHRAHLIGGKFQLSCGPMGGTKVQCIIPLGALS